MPARKTAAPVKKATPRKAPATTKAPAQSNVRKAAARTTNQQTRRTNEPSAQTTNRRNTKSNNVSIGRVGNVGSDPELRFSANGTAVCSVSLAYTPYNFETREQGETVWYRCIGFNQLAEQMAENLSTGMRVIVVGRPQLNEWTDDEGNEHSIKEILLDGIGPDIRFASVSVNRTDRRGPSRSGNDPGMYDDEEPF